MCNFSKLFWSEISKATKTWSIKAQMIFCYLITMASVIFLIICLIMINLNILRTETETKIETTLDVQSRENMLSLIKEGGAYFYSKLNSILIMFGYLNQMIIDMEREETFALDYLHPYSPDNLPQDCLTKLPEYGNHTQVCMEYSSFTNLNSYYNKSFEHKLSRLDNVWNEVFSLTKNIARRYILYFEQGGFYILYPGTKSENHKYYNPQSQVWYKSFVEAGNKTIGTRSYSDSLGNGAQIISVTSPLVDQAGHRIGIISCDLPVDNLSSAIQKIRYLKSGLSMVIYQTGEIISPEQNSIFSTQNIFNISDQNFVQSIKKDPTGIKFLIENSTIYRVAGFKISDYIEGVDEWFYSIFLIVEEREIMNYKEDSRNKIEDTGYFLIYITLGISAFTMIALTVLIYFLAKSISDPLKSIYDFSIKINEKCTKKIDEEDLNSLKEGDSQVSELVQSFKALAGTLVNRPEQRNSRPLQLSKQRIFPPNELYCTDKLKWKGCINSLPDY